MLYFSKAKKHWRCPASMVGCSDDSHIHFLYGLMILLSSAKEQ